MQVCGTLKMRLVQWRLYKRKTTNTNPARGPYHHKSPAAMVRKVVRGMLPKHNERGKVALSHLKCVVGCPAPYDKMKKFSIPYAAAIYTFDPTRKRTLLGRLASTIGWKYADVVARDEAERKARALTWYNKKATLHKAIREAKVKVCQDSKHAQHVELLKQFGYL